MTSLWCYRQNKAQKKSQNLIILTVNKALSTSKSSGSNTTSCSSNSSATLEKQRLPGHRRFIRKRRMQGPERISIWSAEAVIFIKNAKNTQLADLSRSTNRGLKLYEYWLYRIMPYFSLHMAFYGIFDSECRESEVQITSTPRSKHLASMFAYKKSGLKKPGNGWCAWVFSGASIPFGNYGPKAWYGSVSNTRNHIENPTFLRHRRTGLLRKSNPPLYRTGADLLICHTGLGNSPNTS